MPSYPSTSSKNLCGAIFRFGPSSNIMCDKIKMIKIKKEYGGYEGYEGICIYTTLKQTNGFSSFSSFSSIPLNLSAL